MQEVKTPKEKDTPQDKLITITDNGHVACIIGATKSMSSDDASKLRVAIELGYSELMSDKVLQLHDSTRQCNYANKQQYLTAKLHIIFHILLNTTCQFCFAITHIYLHNIHRVNIFRI